MYCGAPATALLVMTYLRGIGRAPRLDPNLPVGIGIAKGKVLALHAIDDPSAAVLGVDHVRIKALR